MTFHADAIYEGGVLRPLVPLDLNEREIVSLAISTATRQRLLEDVAARQRGILLAVFGELNEPAIFVITAY